MADFDTRFRIAVGETDLRSLSFGIKANRGDAYLMLREMPEMKHSFHASGVHRFAEVSGQPRKPMARTTLNPLVEGAFMCIARLVFTTAGDWELYRGATPDSTVLLPPISREQVTIVSLGMTPHHPEDRAETASDNHVATLQLDERKFLTATVATMDLLDAMLAAPQLMTPGRRFPVMPLRYTGRADDRVDEVIHFVSKKNTYIWWLHHDIQAGRAVGWRDTHPLSQALAWCQLVGAFPIAFPLPRATALEMIEAHKRAEA